MDLRKVHRMYHMILKEYPRPKTALKYKNAFQLLVSTVLSAQCTDKRVNQVTEILFKKYKGPSDFALAKQKELENVIRSTGFYRSKARNIISLSRILVDVHKGRVPKSMDGLLELPGVARKTANIVLSHGYGINEGIAIDTHNIRLTRRMGFTKNKDPNKIENDIMKIFPKKEWSRFSLVMIDHGRNICKAPNPYCSKCVINGLCPKLGVKKHY